MTEDRHTDLIAAAQAVVDRWETPLWKDVEPTADVIARLRSALSVHRRGEGEGATPFWVLEDPRCRSWSPTPQYLHKAAEFYGTGKWGKLGGGNELTTPDIRQARRFANRVQAEAFRDASPDLTAWAYEPCEHAMIGAMATPPAREGNDWAEHEDEIADAITDSIDMDWSSRDGARAVVRLLNSLALSTPPVQQEGLKPRPDLAIGALTVALNTTTDPEVKPWLQTAVDFLQGTYEPLESDDAGRAFRSRRGASRPRSLAGLGRAARTDRR